MYVCVWLYFILYVCGCTLYCMCVPSVREERLSRLFRGNKQIINQSTPTHYITISVTYQLPSHSRIDTCILFSICNLLIAIRLWPGIA